MYILIFDLLFGEEMKLHSLYSLFAGTFFEISAM